MKKLFRGIISVVLGLLVLAAGAAGVINVRGIPEYETQEVEFNAAVTPERVARGKKLASMLCQHCHFDAKTQSYSGKFVADAPPEFGKAYAPNITQSQTHGIGTWTDAEIAYLLRTGVKRDGRYAPPWMPKLPLIADEDLKSIIAFLRSDDPLVAANELPDVPCEPSFLTKFLCTVAFKPLPYPDQVYTAPFSDDYVQLGNYLSNNVLACYECHSADFKSNNALHPEQSAGFYGGGNLMLDPEGKPIYTSNITPHKTDGIGSWSKAEFIGAVMYGRRPDGSQLRGPMAPYVALDSSEAGAIYDYLMTVPPLPNSLVAEK